MVPALRELQEWGTPNPATLKNPIVLQQGYCITIYFKRKT